MVEAALTAATAGAVVTTTLGLLQKRKSKKPRELPTTDA